MGQVAFIPIKQKNLAVPCKNPEAHEIVYEIRIEHRFEKTTPIKCDVCGESYFYEPEEILVAQFGASV